MTSQPIWFDNTEAGAPVLNNAAGTLNELLRSCLVNGFNAKTVTSISVASGVATATCAAHGFTDLFGKLVLISGSGEALLNGRKQPGNVLTNSFTYPAPGVADGTYTGTISAKRAPLGWVEEFNTANVSIFARSVVEATAQKLRVVDTAAAPASGSCARAFSVETATDTVTYTGQCPTNTQIAGGQYWQKGQNTATAKKWHVVGDERCFFLFVEGVLAQLTFVPHFFGDLRSIRGTDAYQSVICGNPFDSAVQFGNNGLFYSTSGNGTFAASAAVSRGSSQLGTALLAQIRGGIGNAVFGGATYPLSTNGGNDIVIQHDLLVAENDATPRYPVRGIMPGLCLPWAERPYTSETVVTSLLQEARSYLALGLANSADNGMCLIDLTGPWY